MKLPISIMSLYRNVTLTADILHVIKIAFLSSISVSIKFIALKRILNRKASTLEVAFTRINNL